MKRVASLTMSLMTIALLYPNCLSYPDNLSDCGMNDLSYAYYVHYSVNIDSKTPDGIPIDKGDVNVDLELIDEMSLEVKECLKKNFPTLSVTSQQRIEGECSDTEFSNSYHAAFNYGCWQVKFDPQWTISCSGHQILSQGPPMRPGEKCGGKNLDPTKECPCRYRMAVFEKTFVITPDAQLFKDGLVRSITSCKNPWGNKLLAECASP